LDSSNPPLQAPFPSCFAAIKAQVPCCPLQVLGQPRRSLSNLCKFGSIQGTRSLQPLRKTKEKTHKTSQNTFCILFNKLCCFLKVAKKQGEVLADLDQVEAF
jgi:hypothetical protein